MASPRSSDSPGSVALLSGGVDSAVMTALAAERGERVKPLYVRQGFVWEHDEIDAVHRFLGSLRGRSGAPWIDPLEVVMLSAPGSFASRWALDAGADPPGEASPDEAVFLPGRNLALLTQAALAGYGERLGRIQIGLLAGNPFPDSSPAFLRAFERTASQALGIEVTVETPLAGLTKTEVLELGAHFDLRHTLSCIRPRGAGHCGACNKCAERRAAFRRAGVPDPARYGVHQPAPVA